MDVLSTTECHCAVVLDIGSYTAAAEYLETTQPEGWNVARDRDRVVVIHFHFAAPACDVSTKGKRIQVKGVIALLLWAP
jgi:hypothetical protein